MALRSGLQLLSRKCLSSGFTVYPRVNLSVSTCARGSNVDVVVDDKGLATVSMNKAPVNSLNLEFIQELNETLTETSKNAKGVVLTSSLSSVFCAGNIFGKIFFLVTTIFLKDLRSQKCTNPTR